MKIKREDITSSCEILGEMYQLAFVEKGQSQVNIDLDTVPAGSGVG